MHLKSYWNRGINTHTQNAFEILLGKIIYFRTNTNTRQAFI